jgi:hypothetical protein
MKEPMNIFAAALLLTASLVPGLSQNSSHSESRHFAFPCRLVADRAEAYLSDHGVSTFEKDPGPGNISIIGRQKLWTDGHASEITDFKVYWRFADRKTGEKLPFGMWHLRLSHYWPGGEMTLTSEQGGCELNMTIRFGTNGANMVAILPLDSAWDYESNGRLEREYFDGISTALKADKPFSNAGAPHP